MADGLKKIVAGAVGTVAGVAAGAAAALGGNKNAPHKVEAANEEIYWREHFASEPYYDGAFNFEEYLPAWRTGWEGRAKYAGRSFEDAERDLQADYHWNRGQSRLLWDQARPAVRAAWDHA
jgi:hypothetical protein